MTIAQPNPDVGPTGAEIDEFADAPPDVEERSDDRSSEEEPPEDDPEAKLYSTVPLDTGDGERIIQQQNVGKDNMMGGGEWPDPNTPPQPPAPGAE